MATGLEEASLGITNKLLYVSHVLSGYDLDHLDPHKLEIS